MSGTAAAPTWASTRVYPVARIMRLLAIAIQLSLLVLVMHAFQIEPTSGILKASWLVLFGFLIHAALPLRYRQPFYLALSIAVFVTVLGVPAVLVIVIGLALVAACHVPIAFWLRIALLVIMAVPLIALRANLIHLGPREWYAKSLPVLGSIFMFRLVIYLYDLRHERGPVSLWTRLSYFFLLPNVCFLLFPVVDYQTFRRTYYQRDALDIYQKGVHWIFRGLTHLLLYRVVYYYLSPSPSAVHNLGDVVMFLVSAWLLFLHVSGTFHIAVGILCLFGFDLPETNRLYFLASSPNEIWRRANIYWKDFMMKVFYYPAYKSLQKKKLSLTSSLVVATLVVFVATWWLHSYQWFWIRGRFPVAGVDAVFWTIFASLVLANTLWELKRGKRRTVRDKASWSARGAANNAMKIVGMFALMSVMWSWWSTRNTREWISIVSVSLNGGVEPFALLTVGVIGIVLAGILVQWVAHRWSRPGAKNVMTSCRYSAFAVTIGALLMLGASRPEAQDRLDPVSASFIASLQTERLNARDTELQMRSYYETLMESDQPTSMLAERDIEAPQGENQKAKESDAVRNTGDALGYEYIPSRKTVINSIVQQTNRWGMRDKDYTLQKPPGTRRIALIGGSVIMGSGVDQQDVFESVLEDRLNREYAGATHQRFEILDFAVAGYGMLQYVLVTQRKAFRFDPDILILGTLSGEAVRSAEELTDVIVKGLEVPPFVNELKRFAGIQQGMTRVEIHRRLSNEAVGQKLEAWGYHEIVAECRRHGVVPVWLYLPGVMNVGGNSHRGADDMMRLAREAGFVILDLSNAYVGHTEAELLVAPWDPHPNALGHRLIAERLFEALRANDKALGLGLTDVAARR